MKSLLSHHRLFLSLGVYLLVLLFFIRPYSDFDWGTHYRYGELLVTQGKIQYHDILSWTMYGVKWANHAWIYDGFVYLITRFWGFTGFSLVGGFVGLATFIISVKKFKLTYWQTALLALFFITIPRSQYGEGLRSQTLSLLFLALEFSFIFPLKSFYEHRWHLPILFFVWANIHGSFLIGLAVLGIYGAGVWAADFFKTGRISNHFISLLLFPAVLSFAVTFINPYTYGVYEEAYRHIGNPWLKGIVEWEKFPFDFTQAETSFSIFYVLGLAYTFIRRRQLTDLPHLLLFLLFFGLSISSKRYLTTFLVVTLPYLASVLPSLLPNFGRFRLTPYLVGLIVFIGLQFGFYDRFIRYHITNYSYQDYCDYGPQCSNGLVDFLLASPPSGRVFNFYDWGGYLLGRGITSKLFIDGRMHLWKDATGHQPFVDYYLMYYDQNMDLFQSYNFDWVILKRNSGLDNQLRNTIFGASWAVVYQDDRSSVFKKII